MNTNSTRTIASIVFTVFVCPAMLFIGVDWVVSNTREYFYNKRYCTTKCEGEIMEIVEREYKKGRPTYYATANYLSSYYIKFYIGENDNKLKVGSKITVHYNPNELNKSYVNDDEYNFQIKSGIVMGVTFLVSGGIFLFFIYGGNRKYKKNSHN